MITPRDTAIVGAFIMEGVRDTEDYLAVLSAWNLGAIALVEDVTQYASLIWAMAQTGGEITGDFPGVYDYEVSAPFGKWFAEHILDTLDHSAPTSKQCTSWVKEAALEFFLQVEDNKPHAETLSTKYDALITKWYKEGGC